MSTVKALDNSWAPRQGCRVSVIIPYYNSGWSIARTLRSVLAQRFTDYEVILIDDGSADDAVRYFDAVPGAHDRIRIVRQDNRGLAGARNRGIAESAGEFVAPIDADDLWHPNYLAELVAGLDHHATAPFAFCMSHRIDENDQLLAPLDLAESPRHDFAGLVSLNSIGSGSAAVFRRSALVAAGGYDETLKMRAAQGAEDWKLCVHVAAQNTPAFIPRRLVAYRLTRAGMSQARPDRQLAGIEAVIGDLRATHPHASPALLRDARTMMIAWLLPTFLRHRLFGAALRQGARAYLANPLWWRNSNLRLVHAARARMALSFIAGRRWLPTPLADFVECGEKPFSFLNEGTSPVPGQPSSH